MECENIEEYLLMEKPSSMDEMTSDIKVHVETCSYCRTNFEAWKKIEKNIFGPVPYPKGLDEKIINRIAEERKDDKEEVKVISFWSPAKKIAALLVFGISMWVALMVLTKTPIVKEEQAKKILPKVYFALNLPAAQSVSVIGDFNNWKKGAQVLTKNETGIWELNFELPSGYYQYQLIVDGKKWMLDPNNPNTVPDGFGEYNSVLLI